MPWPPLRCSSLEALFAELVAAQVDFCHGVVDPKSIGEGLQSWQNAHGQVDRRLVGVYPEESQAESMKTVPLGPAIPSSDFNKANSQVANLVRSPQEKNEIKVWCPVDVKASLSHMICWNKWRVWGSWEIHSFKNAPSTSRFIQHLCRTAVVSPLSPTVPQPPQPYPPLQCPSLQAFVAELVATQVDVCHGVVDPKSIGEGLQSWHEAHGQVDSSCCVLHCQLAVPHVWHNHTQGTCQDCHSCPVMSDPHVTMQPTHYWTHLYGGLLPPWFNSLSQSHSLQYLFNVNTFMKLHTPSRKRMGFQRGGSDPQKCWNFKVKNGLPIHSTSTRSHLHGLAAHFRKHTKLKSLKNMRECRFIQN